MFPPSRSQIKVAGQTRVLEGVELQDRNAIIYVTARVDRLWQEGFRSEEAELEEACRPVLVYQQGNEVHAMNKFDDLCVET